ncbi:MAG TPA: hypothetical protein VNV82_17815 [Bryobacteraceae bacterium]|jgi:hypothetical protein|nr:hypothetical protein [Bryobacteraceae bacterium]
MTTTAKDPAGLLALEVLLSDQRASALRELASSHITDGEEALENLLSQRPLADPEDIATRVNGRVRQLDETIAACRRRRMQAIKSMHDQLAAELRTGATQLYHEAGRLRAAVMEALDKLSALEEVTFDLSICRFQRVGPWTTVPGKSLDQCFIDEAVPDFGPGGIRGGYAQPRHFRLVSEAEGLERKALIESEFVVVMHGSETFESIDELLRQVAGDENRIWPPIASIRDWLDNARQAAREKLGPKADTRHTQITLIWKDGDIDRDVSRISLLRQSEVFGIHNPTHVSTLTEVESEIHSVGSGS